MGKSFHSTLEYLILILGKLLEIEKTTPITSDTIFNTKYKIFVGAKEVYYNKEI